MPVRQCRIISAISAAFLVFFAGCDTPGKPEPTMSAVLAPAVLTPTARQSVAGHVVLAADGSPVADAPVFLTSSNRGTRQESLVAKGVTDASGAFRFDNAIAFQPRDPAVNEYEQHRYQVFANHPAHGLSFAVVLPGDKLDALKVRLVRKQLDSIKVVDADGKPLEGARVFYAGGNITEQDAPDWDNMHRWSNLRGDLGVSSATTDAEGVAKIMGLYDGSNYAATKPGYVTSYGTKQIQLSPGVALAGVATYPDGKPAAGAMVKLTYRGANSYWGDQQTTDAAGRYRFDAVPVPGKDSTEGITVAVSHTDGERTYMTSATTRPAAGAEAQMNVQLSQAISVGGKIINDITGEPLPGIRLMALWLIEGQRVYENKEVVAAADGSFSFAVAPGSRVMLQWQDSRDGNYILDREWLQTKGNYAYQPFGSEKLTADKTDLELKLRLWDLQPLTGSVTDAAGEPVAGAQVYMSTRAPAAKTGDDGAFTLRVPRERDFELCAVSKDRKFAKIIKLPKGSTTAAIQLEPTLELSGTVKTPAGLPADNLKFYMDLKFNGESHYRLRQEPLTDAKGNFTAKNVIPGASYGVFWSADNNNNRDYDYGNTEFTAAPNQPITFTAKKYVNALMGQVVDSEGKPVAKAQVSLGPDGYNELLPQDIRFNRTVLTTDDEGRFTIERLADGELPLNITAPGHKPGRFTAATDDVEFVAKLRSLAEPTTIRATVVDPAGKPMEGIDVILVGYELRDGKPAQMRKTIRTDAAGLASFDAPGQAPTTQPAQHAAMLLLCDVRGHDLAFSANFAAGEDMDARLVLTRSTAHWRGQVTDPAGKPIKDAIVDLSAFRINNQYVQLSMLDDNKPDALRTTTNADGEFTLDRLGRDSYVNVSIQAPGMKQLHAYFEPQSDSKTEAKQFTMVQGTPVKGRLIVKSTGQPLAVPPGKQTHLVFQKEGGQYGAGAQPKPDGSFATNELEAGEWIVRFFSMDETLQKHLLPKDTKVSVKPGEANSFDLQLVEGLPVTGKVTGISPGREAYAAVGTTPSQSDYLAGAKLRPDGTFTLYVPEPGTYFLRYLIQEGNVQPSEPREIKVEQGKAVEVVFEHK